MSPQKSRVLIVTYHLLNGVGGGIYASRAYINAFAELFSIDGEVTLLYPQAEGKPIEGIDPRVHLLPVYNKSSRLKKGVDLMRGRVNWHYLALPELLKREQFDIIVFDNSRASKDMIDLAHQYGAKVITIHHNCELEFNRDNSSWPLRPLLLYLTRKYEGDAVRKSDLSLTLTPEDRDLLIKYHLTDTAEPSKIKVLGVFESMPSIDKAFKEKTDSNGTRFVITGNLSTNQTKNSLLPWLDTYYPILKETIPNAQLTIAGKAPGESLHAKCEQLGITLIPSPIDMSPILWGADYYICPTALGGGLKLRIMDGLKSGLQVITHAVSARGYNQFREAGILHPYSNPDSFRGACLAIKQKKYSPSEVIELYNSIFSFKAGTDRLREILENTFPEI